MARFCCEEKAARNTLLTGAATGTSLKVPIGGCDAVARDRGHVLRATVAHYQLELGLHDFENTIHARLPESA